MRDQRKNPNPAPLLPQPTTAQNPSPGPPRHRAPAAAPSTGRGRTGARHRAPVRPSVTSSIVPATIFDSASGPICSPRTVVSINIANEFAVFCNFCCFAVDFFFCLHATAASRWTRTHKSNCTSEKIRRYEKESYLCKEMIRVWKAEAQKWKITTVSWRRRS